MEKSKSHGAEMAATILALSLAAAPALAVERGQSNEPPTPAEGTLAECDSFRRNVESDISRLLGDISDSSATLSFDDTASRCTGLFAGTPSYTDVSTCADANPRKDVGLASCVTNKRPLGLSSIAGSEMSNPLRSGHTPLLYVSGKPLQAAEPYSTLKIERCLQQVELRIKQERILKEVKARLDAALKAKADSAAAHKRNAHADRRTDAERTASQRIRLEQLRTARDGK